MATPIPYDTLRFNADAMWREFSCFAAVIAISAFLLATIRSGEEWEGDNALYIMNAQNIVSGQTYATTPFIPNPTNPINPAAYPPGLPLLIAPIVYFFGVDLELMKLEGIVAFALCLLVYACFVRQELPASLALLAVACVGLHPYIWDFKESICSEFPFMFFTYTSLYLTANLEGAQGSRRWIMLIGAAIAIAMAYLTRSIGVLLFPVVFFAALLRTRSLWNSGTLAVVAALAISMLTQHAFPPDSSTYLSYFHDFTLERVLHNTLHYVAGAGAGLVGSENFTWPLFGYGLAASFAGFCCVGFIARLRRGISVYEMFTAAYLIFLIIYPIALEVSRYSLPVWPLLFFYFFMGLQVAIERIGPARRHAVIAAACIVWSLAFAIQYRSMDLGPIDYSLTDARSREVFRHLEALPEDAIILARKPTVVALFTRRFASIWPAEFDDASFWAYAQQIHATHVLEDLPHFGDPASAAVALHAVIERHQQVEMVFANDWFRLYRVP